MFNYSSDNLTSKEIRIEIGKRLHAERIRAKISLDKLAELTGYSKPTVQRWEKGWKNETGENTIPTLDQIIELCAVYKCSPGYLLCEYHERTKQAFDATLELGLTEESVKLLQRFHDSQMNTLHYAHIDIFMCFLNYLICHSDYLYDLIWDRLKIASTEKLAAASLPGMDMVQKAFDAPELQRYLNSYRAFYTNELYSRGVKLNLIKALKEYFDKQTKHPIFSSDYLTDAAMKYAHEVFPMSHKQSDFLISEAFLEVVNSFYKNSHEEFNTYDKFIKQQLQKKLNETPPCVRT